MELKIGNSQWRKNGAGTQPHNERNDGVCECLLIFGGAAVALPLQLQAADDTCQGALKRVGSEQ